MIANKMESNGDRARVQVSNETKELLENAFPGYFEFEFNKDIEFKIIQRATKGWFVKNLNYYSKYEVSDNLFNGEVGGLNTVRFNDNGSG